MRQQGDNFSNIQIGNAGSGNTISVFQNQFRADHTLLVVDESSVHKYDKETLRNDRNKGFAKIAGGGLFCVISYFSDAIGISNHFGFPLWCLGLVGLIGCFLSADRHRRSWDILRKLRTNKNEAYLAGTNELAKESENGKIVTYFRRAACIYPNCTGTIEFSNAPEREKERLGKDYVGICSLAKRDHSYRIDAIWNAYPADFDWRPMEQNAKKH